ncbi:MAG: DNA-3-methyladenine glycosylase [Candidatus Kaiserbacteria bacterium]|nr:DNA-3-methyladenine glycosylase [Candidatus Kaiserbacteria bacterium]
MRANTTVRTLPDLLAKNRYFKHVIKKHGVPSWENRGTVYQSLVRSIVYQQVSGKAAASILKKFISIFGTKFPTPQQVLQTPVATLRTAGLSSQKVSYILDLSTKINDGTIKPRAFAKMTNEQIVEHLTKVKGIGVWTAQMFLMSTLHREDVLPTLDLGIKKGFQIMYKLEALPTHEEMELMAKKWRPHASLASWYLWRIADEHKPVKKLVVRK